MDVESIFSFIFGPKKLKAGSLRKEWYSEKGRPEIYEQIVNLTFFLDQYNPTIRERIFYLQNGLKSPVLCPFCNHSFLRLGSNARDFLKSCGQENCEFLRKSNCSKYMHSLMSEEKRLVKNSKIGKSNSISLLQRYGTNNQRIEEIKQKMSARSSGRKQTAETKKKRYETRKNNGKLSLTEETRKKISESNKKTHSSEEFKQKYKEVYTKAREKQSVTVKEKIAAGIFTPNITNSWTHWSAFYKFSDGSCKKFRSTWEAIFYSLNLDLEYETLRIKYKTSEGKERIYIVDFVDRAKKIAYEIKPSSLMAEKNNAEKHEALLDWASKNEYSVKIIDELWLKAHISLCELANQPQLLKGLEALELC